jgi:DNA repair protein RadC
MPANPGPRIQDLPRGDRPRERLWAKGPDALSDAELLALVLRSGRPGESALRLATRMLADFGGVRMIAMARPEELAAYPGIGAAKAAALVSALRLASRAASAGPESLPIKSPADLAAIAAEALGNERRERVVVLVLDSGHRLRRVVPISEGSIDRTMFPAREILNAVLRHDGRAFAVAHNHPGGDSTPTRQDVQATRALRNAAQATGLRFLDHLVVADNGWSSVVSRETR